MAAGASWDPVSSGRRARTVRDTGLATRTHPRPRPARPLPKRRGQLRSDRLQVLDQVALLGIAEAQILALIEEVDDVQQGREAAVVEEAAGALVQPPGERGGAVLAVGRAVGLEAAALIVHAELGGRVQVPARLGEHRRHVAAGAATLAI